MSSQEHLGRGVQSVFEEQQGGECDWSHMNKMKRSSFLSG